MTIDDRSEQFKKDVQDKGGLIYSKHLLTEFIEYWGEPNRARGKSQKLRWELQKTWSLTLRLKRFALNAKYNPYLTSSQKTIAEKKREFVKVLTPYIGRYTRAMLNAFFRHWSQPENKPNPELLKWETMQFWDIGSRLAAWHERAQQQQQLSNERT